MIHSVLTRLTRQWFVLGPHAVARAFTHGAQLALLANLSFMIVALILALAVPRQIPEHAGR